MASKRSLKRLVRRFSLDFIAVFEPKATLSKAPSICRYLGMDYYETNLDEDSKIWIFWNSPLSFLLVAKSSQHVSGVVQRSGSDVFKVSAVYAACDVLARRDLFEDLLSFSANISIPWIVDGILTALLIRPRRKEAFCRTPLP